MRFVALLLSLLSTLACADSDVLPEQRKQQIATAAREAAAGLDRFEYYVPYLHPVPERMLHVSKMDSYVLFGDGWSTRTPRGIWSLNHRSTLYLRLAPGQHPKQLFIHGNYYNGAEATRLFINGQLVSEAPLEGLTVALPAGLATASELTIELQHLNPREVAPGSQDNRRIKFNLIQLRVW